MAELGRFGLVTPKSIGKAHDRNLIKRRLRHIISLYPEILHQHDLILLALPNSQTASFDELIRDVSNSIQQILDRRRARNTRRSFLTSAPSLPGENDVH